jgi:pilus assembly protein CpaF
VGEVRGGEVVDLLAALNTGHDGGCESQVIMTKRVATCRTAVESLARSTNRRSLVPVGRPPL